VAVALLWIVGVVFVAGALIGPIKTHWVEIPAVTGARRGVLFGLGVLTLALGAGLWLVDPGHDESGQSADGGVGQPATTSPGTHTVTTAAATAPSEAGTDTETTTARTATVLWRGRVRLPSRAGVDVGDETTPPKVETYNSFATSFIQRDGEARTGQSDNNLLSEWTTPGDPTPTQCVERLRTQPTETIGGYRKGLRFCTHGLFDQRVAFVRVLSYTGGASEVELTIWGQHMP
jgi:hypothetical protein